MVAQSVFFADGGVGALGRQPLADRHPAGRHRRAIARHLLAPGPTACPAPWWSGLVGVRGARGSRSRRSPSPGSTPPARIGDAGLARCRHVDAGGRTWRSAWARRRSPWRPCGSSSASAPTPGVGRPGRPVWGARRRSRPSASRCWPRPSPTVWSGSPATSASPSPATGSILPASPRSPATPSAGSTAVCRARSPGAARPTCAGLRRAGAAAARSTTRPSLGARRAPVTP